MPVVRAERSKWIKGPKFIEFLEEHNLTSKKLNDQVNFDMLRKGENISVWRADRILTKVGLHILDLPHKAWMPFGYDPRSSTRNNLKEHNERRKCNAKGS